MKKLLILCLALAVLLLAGCKGKPAEETAPGVDDSIFDHSGGVEIIRPEDTTADTEQDTTQSTKPEVSKPTIPDGPQNPGQVEELTPPVEDETPTKPQNPEQTQPTTPEDTEPPKEDTPPVDPTKLDYLQFHALNAKQQQAVMESFDSIEDFFLWYDGVKETYEKENPSIEVDGPIDLDKVLGGQ